MIKTEDLRAGDRIVMWDWNRQGDVTYTVVEMSRWDRCLFIGKFVADDGRTITWARYGSYDHRQEGDA